jgi:O-antigen ligase
LPRERQIVSNDSGRPVGLPLRAALGCVAAVIVLSPTNPFGEQRPYYWAAAWHDYQSHPFLGSGAGTYAISWHEERPLPVNVQDAHSLYLETLAEVALSACSSC